MDRGAPSNRSLTRVRYETKRRLLTVTAKTALTPHLIRITLSGDFDGFQSPGFDDHVKLFFPDPVTGVLALPAIGNPPVPGAIKPLMRDYTPRRFDALAQTLDIEFALHDSGPATKWALSAEVGDTITLGGPRGSTLIPLAFDGYVLIGDDTALPAIARRLEELPAGTKVIVVAEVGSQEDRLEFTTQADVHITWVYRRSCSISCLNDSLRALHLPQNDIHVWVACEASQAKLIRAQLIEDHGVNPAWIKASGYWHKGHAGAEKTIET